MQHVSKMKMDHGYEIDNAYRQADRYLVNSDKWNYWMDRAKELEEKAKRNE